MLQVLDGLKKEQIVQEASSFQEPFTQSRVGSMPAVTLK